MNSRDFVYWLQGFFEISEENKHPEDKGNLDLSSAQVKCIRNHLNMVFKHEIDPSHGDAAHQAALSALHEGGGAPGQPPKPPLEDLLRPGVDLTGPRTMFNC